MLEYTVNKGDYVEISISSEWNGRTPSTFLSSTPSWSVHKTVTVSQDSGQPVRARIWEIYIFQRLKLGGRQGRRRVLGQSPIFLKSGRILRSGAVSKSSPCDWALGRFPTSFGSWFESYLLNKQAWKSGHSCWLACKRHISYLSNVSKCGAFVIAPHDKCTIYAVFSWFSLFWHNICFVAMYSLLCVAKFYLEFLSVEQKWQISCMLLAGTRRNDCFAVWTMFCSW